MEASSVTEQPSGESITISRDELSRLRAIEAAAKRFDEAGSQVHQMSRKQWDAYTELKALFHGGVKFRT